MSAVVAFYVVLFTWNPSDSKCPEPAESHGGKCTHFYIFIVLNKTNEDFSLFLCLNCLFANDKMQTLTWWHGSLGALNRRLKIGCYIILALIQTYSSFGLLGSIFH